MDCVRSVSSWMDCVRAWLAQGVMAAVMIVIVRVVPSATHAVAAAVVIAWGAAVVLAADGADGKVGFGVVLAVADVENNFVFAVACFAGTGDDDAADDIVFVVVVAGDAVDDDGLVIVPVFLSVCDDRVSVLGVFIFLDIVDVIFTSSSSSRCLAMLWCEDRQVFVST